MNIKSWQKTSVVDYPDKIVTTIITGECNFNCKMCCNRELVHNSDNMPSFSKNEVIQYLERKRNLIDGICISGGEPTINKDIIPFMKKIKFKEQSVKLNTNGYLTEQLREIIKNRYLDYISLDIKNSPEKYAETVGIEDFDISRINDAIQLIKNSKLDYDFRITICKELHTEEDLIKIGEWLKGSKRLCINTCIKKEDADISEEFTPYSKEEMLHFKDILAPYFEDIRIGGS